MPDQKSEVVARYKAQGRVLAMAGGAGVTLLKGDLNGIVKATSGRTLFFAFIYNAAGVPIAAGVLYPVFGILLSLAAAAMALSPSV